MQTHRDRPAHGVTAATLTGAILLAILHGTAFAQTQPATGQNAPAAVSSQSNALLPEPGFLERAVTSSQRTLHLTAGESSEVKNGFYPELSNMPTGSGWISLGPGYRRWLANDRVLIDGSAAISWRAYKMAQARVELPRLAHSRVVAGSQVRWQDLTQMTFFGEGADSTESTRSEYRLKSTNVVGYATVRPTQWLSIGSRIGWLSSPSVLPPAGTFKRGNPDVRDVFPTDIVYTTPEQPSFVHGDLSITADTRDHRSHPTNGGLYRAAWGSYADRNGGAFSFRRSEVEGAQFVPVAGARVVFALHGWLVASGTDANGVVPFYLMPSLGGNNTIRAYSDFRFHDRNMLVVNAEARVAVYRHLDAALFVDAGNVASRVGDLNLDKRAYGVGLRLHTEQSTFTRLDVAHGDEGWRFVFRLSEPLHLSRLSRRMAALPFVP
ncbi:MAG: BamA/TamA family outer membrane protein [Vicinamibacterales bacterium]